jgi:5-methyltetrahydrofolate--homocysteine methyltransferase
VEDDLRGEYANGVFYADDAFAGLHIMEDLATADGARAARIAEGRTGKSMPRPRLSTTKPALSSPSAARS